MNLMSEYIYSVCVCVCVCVSQLVDHPKQAFPSGGPFMLELVVVEKEQGTQHLPAADDGGHILEGGSRPWEASHYNGKYTLTATEHKAERRNQQAKVSSCTFYCRYVSVEFGSAGEGRVLQHHSKKGRGQTLQG